MQAAAPRESAEDVALGSHLNANTVAVISGTPGGTYFRMASDLAFVLDGVNDLRVLPVMGKGAGQNAYDLRYLRGIDIAFVRTDSLDQLRRDKRVGKRPVAHRHHRPLFNDELHVVAPREITDIRQLAGRKVSLDVRAAAPTCRGGRCCPGSGLPSRSSTSTSRGRSPCWSGARSPPSSRWRPSPWRFWPSSRPATRFHLLDVPFADGVAESYMPAELAHADYPLLAPGGKTVRTLAVAPSWRPITGRRAASAMPASPASSMPSSASTTFLKPPRHPKWREVNLAAEVADWPRFPPPGTGWSTAPPRSSGRGGARRGAQVLSQRRGAVEVDRDQLYQEFLKWRDGGGGRVRIFEEAPILARHPEILRVIPGRAAEPGIHNR